MTDDLLVTAEMLHTSVSQTALLVIDQLPPVYQDRYARYVLETYSNMPTSPRNSVRLPDRSSVSDHALSETLQNILRHSPPVSPY